MRVSTDADKSAASGMRRSYETSGWGSQSKKRIMKERIERSRRMLPSDEEISHAKWLADGRLFLKFIANLTLD